MKLAKVFLERFAKLTPPKAALKKTVAQTILSMTGVPVKDKDVSFSNDTAFIKVSSVAKNVIHLARTAILRTLSENPVSRGRVRDIR